MKIRAEWWATLALAGSVSGHAFGQIRSIEVQPAPVHQAIDSPDDGDAAGLQVPAPPGGQAAFAQDPGPAPAEQAGAFQSAPPPQIAEQPAADPGPRVVISRRVIDAAGAFDGYMHRASAIKPSFSSGATVARAVALGSVYEPGQLQQGEIAYAALVALQDAEFVEAVRDAGVDPATREAFAARLVDQPESVLAAGAARKAATRVSMVLGHMGAQLVVAGAAVKQASYDVQSQDWSRGAIVGPDEHLARIKAESAMPISLQPADQAHLLGSLAVFRSVEGRPAEAETATAAVTRGMALAALAVLGQAGDDQPQRIDALLNDPLDGECLKMAKLNDLQCLAVAGPHYENLFCLGNHGMMETGKCIVGAAGGSQDALLAETDRRSVFVPVAMTTAGDPGQGQGLERSSVFSPSGSSAGVAVPAAAAEPAVNYSPYAGPTD
jgi:hypothetical protein